MKITFQFVVVYHRIQRNRSLFETYSFSTFLKQKPKWTALAVLNAPTLFAEIKRFCFYVKATVTSNYDDKRMRVEIGRENLQLR